MKAMGRSFGDLRNDAGATILDTLAGMAFLAIVVSSLANFFLGTMTQAKSAGLRAEAAVWAQAELDYLRGLSYPNSYQNSCLTVATNTYTPTSSGCTSLQPALPSDFTKATVQIDTVPGQSGLKRITIQVYQTATTVLFTTVTYVAQYS